MGVLKKQHDKPWLGTLEKGYQCQKMETRKISPRFKHPQSSKLCQALGGEQEVTHLELKIEKNTNSNLFFFLIKNSTSDLDALTILDHACKIIKCPFSTQTSENLISRQTSL